MECDFYYREPTQDPLCPSEVINKKETIKITVSKIIELLGRNECIPKPKELFEKELVEKEISDRVGDIFRQEVFLGKKYFNRELKWFYDFDQMYDCLWAEDLITNLLFFFITAISTLKFYYLLLTINHWYYYIPFNKIQQPQKCKYPLKITHKKTSMPRDYDTLV